METVYLYSLWTDQLAIYEGEIKTSFRDGLGRFNCKQLRKVIQCSINPEVIHNKTVWLKERDDNKAKLLLKEYEEACINELEFKIKNHLAKIKMLDV